MGDWVAPRTGQTHSRPPGPGGEARATVEGGPRPAGGMGPVWLGVKKNIKKEWNSYKS